MEFGFRLSILSPLGDGPLHRINSEYRYRYYSKIENDVNHLCIVCIFNDHNESVEYHDDDSSVSFDGERDFQEIHAELLSKGYYEVGKDEFYRLVEEKFPDWRAKGEAEDRERKRQSDERIAAYRQDIHRTFKLAVLEAASRENIGNVLYFKKNGNPRLLVARIFRNGSALGTYTNGSTTSYGDDVAAENPEAMIRSDAAEQGYTEISETEFMRLVDEYYPEWRRERKP